MDTCPPDISSDMATVRDEAKNWASSLKAPKDWDSGEAVSLKAKFCHFMRFGDNGTLLTETMEIGERLLQWSKDQELPFHAYKQHLGGHRKMDWSGEAEHQAIPRQQSPDRRAPEEYSRVTQKRARSREEEYTKVTRRRESPKGRSRERARRPSPRVERQPSPRPERRPERPSPKFERRPSSDNHHKTVHGTGGNEKHRQTRRRRDIPRRQRSTPPEENQRRAAVREISGSSSHAHTVDGSTSTFAS